MDDLIPQSGGSDGSIGHQLIDINSNYKNGSFPRKQVDAPEKKLTLIALRLAVLQKMSTGLGAQGFVWATVVLLGGFVSVIHSTDFDFVTIIILTESARIFSRRHELQWTLESPWSTSDANAPKPRAKEFIVESIKVIKGRFPLVKSQALKQEVDEATPSSRRSSNRSSNSTISTTSSEEEEAFSFADWVLLSRNFSKVFYFLQLLSALSCITLSVVRLVQLSHDSTTYSDVSNLRPALFIFYGLALAEASLSLLEKAYKAWTIHYSGLLEEVNTHYDLGGRRGMTAIKRFFDVTYLHCLKGTIFDGLNDDLVSFATKLLSSDNSRKQRLGALILEKLTDSDFSEDAVRNIGTSKSVTESLVYLLRSEVADTKKSATKIVAKLAAKRQTSPLIAAIPGAIECISSLLDNKRSSDSEFDENGHENCYSIYHQLGLQILEQLSRDYNICKQMARTIGVLPNILSALAREDPELRIKSARIVSKLYKFLSKDCFVQVNGGVSAAASIVLRAIILAGNKEEEVMLELANQLFTSMTKEEANIALNRDGVDDQTKLAMKLLQILKFNPNPSAKVPKTKKLVTELAISMMNKDEAMARIFRNIGMGRELKNLETNKSEIESSLARKAFELLVEE